MKFDAINLDYYGTLVDWLAIWIDVSQEIVSETPLDVDSKELALHWRKVQRALLDEQEYLSYKENITIALQRTATEFGFESADYPERLFSKWVEIRPFEEVEETLQTLNSNFRLAICTNSAIDLYHASATNLAVTFDHIVVSDDIQANKPHPKMYAVAQERLDVPYERILHVASSQMDVRGATKAGFSVCWINRLNEPRAQDTPEPSYEILTLDQILPIVS